MMDTDKSQVFWVDLNEQCNEEQAVLLFFHHLNLIEAYFQIADVNELLACTQEPWHIIVIQALENFYREISGNGDLI